jgi:hypothetical protein
MATPEGSAGDPARNPTITIVEPATVTVAPDFDVAGITLEVVDREGQGFGTVLDQAAAIDVVLRIVGAVARLRRYGVQP